MTTTTTAAVARFKIGDKTYTTASLDEISLRDLMLFESQAADIGLHVSYTDIEQLAVEFGELDEEQAQHHPKALLMTAVTIWASRKVAGDDVTFGEAIDIPVSSIEFLTPVEDVRPRPTQAPKPSKAKGAKKSGNPAKRAASAAPAAPEAEPAEDSGSDETKTFVPLSETV